jgi:hypothetical protein
MPDKYQSPVFIVGLPRSGTTLLQSLLCSSEQFFPVPETHFFSRAARGLPALELSTNDLDTVVDILRTKAMLEYTTEELAGCVTKKQAFECIIDRYNTAGSCRFLEKTPRHIFFYDEIMTLYPSARFICLLREPRNHAASILNMGDRGKTMVLLAMAYNRFVSVAQAIAGEGNALVLQYEKLADSPEDTLRHICSFIDIPYDEEMFRNFGETARKVVGDKETWRHAAIDSKSVEQNEPDKWRKTLSVSEANLVSFLTRRSATELGYPVDCHFGAVLGGLMRDCGKIWKLSEMRRFAAEFKGE